MTRPLEDRTAVIYGAGGAIGGAVARAFARDGARVFLTGRTLPPLERVATEIARAGGVAQVAQVDALVETAIETHLDQVMQEAGSVDVSFNAVGFNEVQGVRLVDLSLEDFRSPIARWSQTVFLTSRGAARRMTKQGSGVILTVIPPAAGTGLASGFGAACATIDSISRTLAAEVGAHGVRVLILQPNALPESEALQASFAKYAKGLGITPRDAIAELASGTLLKRLPTLTDIGDVAAFAASDKAAAMTGTVLAVDCGSA
jgi:NAD(P)-dependent dehydrogenase (short-subunit alcohol dehydrogenase family)